MKFQTKGDVVEDFVEAVQWTGDNPEEVLDFMMENSILSPIHQGHRLYVPTPKGERVASPGDWIVKVPYPLGGFCFFPHEANEFSRSYFFMQFLTGRCGCCGFKEVPLVQMDAEKAYVCWVCFTLKTPKQRLALYASAETSSSPPTAHRPPPTGQRS